ncbi:hypothetical protein HYC85_002365 [Camellia sinensis]|uniref:Uncharacterized protein n=1 Tax=Camellia sinensis TaxID=4442 RepID=A0A7J7I9E9_CAMSI|nr:hypothetical protein HYC85_002365 [Camellia sinensis]
MFPEPSSSLIVALFLNKKNFPISLSFRSVHQTLPTISSLRPLGLPLFIFASALYLPG